MLMDVILLDSELIFNIVKIGATVCSIIVLWLFRRNITKVVIDLMVGGDSSKYVDRDPDTIVHDVENRMKEVLK